ncbi:ubiquitin 3 binding protein But2 C-terminal domain-containing protein [Aspergillus avenaceus]|uniref:Ubiquitin 3 binding protein But2 C-terminal domain-containing protein n=1 Tax=Aspergillus avenaceus TaxID=36643 RepID=A0A5N6TSD9_ASPAV|nr:ubiquitin 3 binding protein But2 C-terminal domain-containing protein [Aspergillus avenaceus]
MKNFATVAAFAAGANALVGRSNSCCFHINASGGASGTVGQLDDGQNRIYGGLSPVEFCIDSNGGITDASGRGCIITGPTTQLQCDEGATATTGFTVDSQGQISYKGDQDFVACETGQDGGLNIYTTESDAMTGCKDVKLSADSCANSGASSSSSSSVAVPGSSTPIPGPSSSASVPYVPGQSSSASVPYVPGQSSTASVPYVPGQSPSPSVPVVPGQSSGVYPVPGSSTGGTVTVHTTVTATYCESGTAPAGTPGVPGTSGIPGVPGSSSIPVVPGTSEVPGVPGASSTSVIPGTSGTPVPGTSGVPGTPGTSGTPGASGSQPSQTATGSQPSGTSTAGGSCPTDLSGDYEYPHLIIPVDSSSPDDAPGTSYNGTITDTVSTIFNFDIPSSDSGKTCSLVFLFPKKEDLETSSYSFSGDGKVEFSSLASAATESTSYNNAPSVKEDLGDFTISPGNSYLVSTFACPAGEAVSYEMKNAGSTELDFFEDYNPSPLGLYITVC